jgi:hypothetical protein
VINGPLQAQFHSRSIRSAFDVAGRLAAPAGPGGARIIRMIGIPALLPFTRRPAPSPPGPPPQPRRRPAEPRALAPPRPPAPRPAPSFFMVPGRAGDFVQPGGGNLFIGDYQLSAQLAKALVFGQLRSGCARRRGREGMAWLTVLPFTACVTIQRGPCPRSPGRAQRQFRLPTFPITLHPRAGPHLPELGQA